MTETLTDYVGKTTSRERLLLQLKQFGEAVHTWAIYDTRELCGIPDPMHPLAEVLDNDTVLPSQFVLFGFGNTFVDWYRYMVFIK